MTSLGIWSGTAAIADEMEEASLGEVSRDEEGERVGEGAR